MSIKPISGGQSLSISALILENPSYSSDLTYKTILATEFSNNKYNQQVKASVKLDAKVFNYYKNTSYNRFALFEVSPIVSKLVLEKDDSVNFDKKKLEKAFNIYAYNCRYHGICGNNQTSFDYAEFSIRQVYNSLEMQINKTSKYTINNETSEFNKLNVYSKLSDSYDAMNRDSISRFVLNGNYKTEKRSVSTN